MTKNNLLISIKNIVIEFPVFDEFSRSFKKVSMTKVGGKVHGEKIPIVTALQDISLDLYVGDRLILLGNNGAGKTTLLNAIMGIYPPVRGTIYRNHKKLFSFMNIYLGLDPELSGEKNVFIMGRFQGLSKKQCKQILPNIEHFAELGPYFYLPVKRYSAGMATRFYFAFATSFSPDILVSDELIGAGDKTFVDKVEKRLTSTMKNIRSMVIATHSPDLALRYGTKAILLDKGHIVEQGKVKDVLLKFDYEKATLDGIEESIKEREKKGKYQN